MEEQLNKYFSEYEMLLKTKDYKLLSDHERSIVHRFSTEEEYGKMRKIILSNAELTDVEREAVIPDSEILNKLLHTMKSKQTSKSTHVVFNNIFSYKIPAYQFVVYAAVLLIVILLVFKNEKTIIIEKPLYITKTDTIEKYIVKETKPITKNHIKTNTNKIQKFSKTNKQEKPDSSYKYNDNIFSEKRMNLMGMNINIREKIENFKPKGRTMHDDSLLVKFLVKI